MNSKSLPLNIVGTEVPKYTVRLFRSQIQLRGTLIGLRLDSWSANTWFKLYDLGTSLYFNNKYKRKRELAIQKLHIILPH